jgi:hypothetical protein
MPGLSEEQKSQLADLCRQSDVAHKRHAALLNWCEEEYKAGAKPDAEMLPKTFRLLVDMLSSPLTRERAGREIRNRFDKMKVT